MQIYNNPIGRVSKVYQNQQKSAAVDKKKGGSNKDKVTLSNQGKEFQAVLSEVAKAPDIRAKAEEIKQAVSSGTYNVSGEQIATSLLKHLK